jgi:transposase-like protein
VDLEGHLSNPAKPLTTLTPQGLSAPSPTREAPPTRQKRPRARRGTRPSDELGHYSNPPPAATLEPPSGDVRDTPPPAARHRTQRRLRDREVDTLVEAYRAGKTIKQVAQQFGITRTTVMAHLDRRHVQRRLAAKQWDDATLAGAAASYAKGYSLAHIAHHHDLDPQTVANRLRRAGVAIRPRPGWEVGRT